jgi:hypothetical protein
MKNEQAKKTKAAIAVPEYLVKAPNTAITLMHQEEVSVTVGERKLFAAANIIMRMMPSPRVIIQVPLPDQMEGLRMIGSSGTDAVLHLPAWNARVDCLRTGVEGEILSLTPKREPFTLGSPRTLLKVVSFHVFNMPDFQGSHRECEKVGKTQLCTHHLVLSSDPYRITISSMSSTSENVKLVKGDGGYALTHVGRIEREGGRSFTGRDAAEVLTSLHFFLSLACGRWVSPSLAIGKTAKGTAKWFQMGLGQCDPWRYCLSWFGGFHGRLLEEVFPCFMQTWKSQGWHASLKKAIYWYLVANGNDLDSGIILTQSAMELLAWTYVVKEHRLLSEAGLKSLWASDRIRLLGSSVGIPMEIPSCLAELRIHAKRMQWVDAMHAFTEIRNSIVHPDHKRAGKHDNALYEAYNMGLWYLDLLFLRLFGYRGKYSNRLKSGWVGDTEDVPWT